MTIHVVRRRDRNRSKTKTMPNQLAIGEIDQTIFACPECARPLAIGSRRCPACGTRLLMGIQARRAGTFVGLGFLLGIALAGFSMVASSGLDRLVRDVAAVVTGPRAPAIPAVSAPPVASAIPGASAGTVPGPTIPPVGRTALLHAFTLDGQLVAATTALETHLTTRTLDTNAVSQILRRMSADALFGLDVSAQLLTWETSAALGSDFGTIYGSIRTTAANALAASLRNDDAYRAAARTMVGLRGELLALDAWAREIAAGAGIEVTGAGSPVPAP